MSGGRGGGIKKPHAVAGLQPGGHAMHTVKTQLPGWWDARRERSSTCVRVGPLSAALGNIWACSSAGSAANQGMTYSATKGVVHISAGVGEVPERQRNGTALCDSREFSRREQQLPARGGRRLNRRDEGKAREAGHHLTGVLRASQLSLVVSKNQMLPWKEEETSHP